jgi:hypothetical protein
VSESEKERARAAKAEKARARAAKQERRRARAARVAEEGSEKQAARVEARRAPSGKPERDKTGKSPRERPPIWKRKAVRGRLRTLRRRWKYTRRGVRRVYNRRYRFTYRHTIHRVPSRDELPPLLNARGLLGRGAEIGVKQGRYSDELLRNWRGSELVSIDPWLSADPDEYVDRSNVSQDRFNEFYEETRERLAGYGSRSTIWRMTSIEAAPRVPDGSLDFVYIDARHDYESVKEDLEAWCSKVRPGGILAGHDYVDGDLPEGEFYVKSAVDEFFGEREIPVHGTEGPSAVESFPTWIVEVPEDGITPTAAGKEAAADASADIETSAERSPV